MSDHLPAGSLEVRLRYFDVEGKESIGLDVLLRKVDLDALNAQEVMWAINAQALPFYKMVKANGQITDEGV